MLGIPITVSNELLLPKEGRQYVDVMVNKLVVINFASSDILLTESLLTSYQHAALHCSLEGNLVTHL